MSGSDDLTLKRRATIMVGMILGVVVASVTALIVGGRALGLG